MLRCEICFNSVVSGRTLICDAQSRDTGGLKRISSYTCAKSKSHVACVMRNGSMDVPQDTPIGKATVRLQKQRLKALFNNKYQL